MGGKKKPTKTKPNPQTSFWFGFILKKNLCLQLPNKTIYVTFLITTISDSFWRTIETIPRMKHGNHLRSAFLKSQDVT